MEYVADRPKSSRGFESTARLYCVGFEGAGKNRTLLLVLASRTGTSDNVPRVTLTILTLHVIFLIAINVIHLKFDSIKGDRTLDAFSCEIESCELERLRMKSRPSEYYVAIIRALVVRVRAYGPDAYSLTADKNSIGACSSFAFINLRILKYDANSYLKCSLT